MSSSDSYSNAFRKRLIKNKGAVLGLVVIFVAFFLAVFAYLIAPDHSPNANKMTVEIGGEKPGYTIRFLKIKNESNSEKTSFFAWLLNGKDESYSLLPIVSTKEKLDSVVVEKYVDEGV